MRTVNPWRFPPDNLLKGSKQKQAAGHAPKINVPC